MVTSGSGEAWTSPDVWAMGGTGPADAATESFMRYLAAEVGPRGVRVACLWTAGVVLENDPLHAAKDMLVSILQHFDRQRRDVDGGPCARGARRAQL